jgi:hypothetical protein
LPLAQMSPGVFFARRQPARPKPPPG